MNVLRYLIVSGAYILVYSAAWIVMEVVEGNKIARTDYASLMNYGSSIVFLIVCLVMASVIVALPFTMVVDRLLKKAWLRMLVLTSISVSLGARLFYVEYHDYLEEYDLRLSTACLLFGLAGLIYSMTNEMLRRSQQKGLRQKTK